MTFHFVTLFPELILPYFKDSILSRAVANNLISLHTHNPRDYTKEKHRKTDDTISGGGSGMLFSPQPMFDCLAPLKKTHIIFLSPTGKPFSQKDAKNLAKKEEITFVCGRYEGFDERIVEEFADEIYSIGDFVLTGGELPALCMCDAISRNIGGVLGNEDATKEESFESGLVEYPSFTKPATYLGRKTPSVFLEGNHKKIDQARHEMALCKTKFARVDLYLDNK